MPAQPLNPFIGAAFSDVPYILDSLWRWADFRAYRLGEVGLTGRHAFTVRHTTPWPIFGLYLVISSLVVFGPTYTTLCSSFGYLPAHLTRLIAGGLILAVAVAATLRSTGDIILRLERRGRQLRSPPALAETQAQEPQVPALTGLAQALRTQRGAPGPLRRLGQWTRGVLDAVAAMRSFRGLRLRLLGAFTLLGLAMLLVLGPLALAGWTVAFSNPYDPRVCGPARWSAGGGWQLLAATALFLWGVYLWRRRATRLGYRQLWLTLLGWCATAGALWLRAGPGAREAYGGAYHQSYFLILGVLLGTLVLAHWLARRLTRSIPDTTGSTLREALSEREIFSPSRSEPELGGMRIFAAMVNGLAYHPLHLLLLPALVAVMLPTQWLWPVTIGVFLFGALLLTYGSVARRWQELIDLVGRWCLSGTPLFVSLLVILLALLRLSEVQYVTTLLDAAPLGVISALIAGAYATVWFFEYWLNRWIAERLLALFGAGDDGRDGYVAYAYRGPLHANVRVARTGRVLALHGIGQFCAQGWFPRQPTQEPPRGQPSANQVAFTVYSMPELLSALGTGHEIANDLTRRAKLYFALVNVLLLGVGGALLYWQQRWDRPLSDYQVISARDDATLAPAHFADLRALLATQAARGRPALIVAASGGGTRAALYAATALEGIARLNRAGDVVLISGVSGGGVAAAYFARHAGALSAPYARSQRQWGDFKSTMTEPFIEDVLDGVGELRIAADVPLGELLAESLERRVFGTDKLGDLAGPALILNTTISGHPWNDSQILANQVAMNGASCIERSQPFTSLAGSRLIFTNLRSFPREPMVMPDVGMLYVVVRDPRVGLAQAAAVNANFPPVFSNARVRIANAPGSRCPGVSYYVTDGGATENLGLVSALYALRSVLEAWPKGERVPPLHLIAVEASAISYDYSDDRGVGAATGGSKERINGSLTGELVHGINARLDELGAGHVHLHYLPLPAAFRSRGGFGTHWMYADRIRVSNPLVPQPGIRALQFWHQHTGRTAYVYLDHRDMDILWSALFRVDPHQPFCPTALAGGAAVHTVHEWLCGHDAEWHLDSHPDLQIDEWQTLIRELNGPAP